MQKECFLLHFSPLIRTMKHHSILLHTTWLRKGEKGKKKYAEVIWCILCQWYVTLKQVIWQSLDSCIYVYIYIQTYIICFFIKIFNQSNLQIFFLHKWRCKERSKAWRLQVSFFRHLPFSFFLFFLTKEGGKQTNNQSYNTIYIFFRCYMLYFMCDCVFPLLLLQSRI